MFDRDLARQYVGLRRFFLPFFDTIFFTIEVGSGFSIGRGELTRKRLARIATHILGIVLWFTFSHRRYRTTNVKC